MLAEHPIICERIFEREEIIIPGIIIQTGYCVTKELTHEECRYPGIISCNSSVVSKTQFIAKVVTVMLHQLQFTKQVGKYAVNINVVHKHIIHPDAVKRIFSVEFRIRTSIAAQIGRIVNRHCWNGLANELINGGIPPNKISSLKVREFS